MAENREVLLDIKDLSVTFGSKKKTFTAVDKVSFQIYKGETPVSCTLQYSADTYGNNKTGDLLELCKALFAYSDSAGNYFKN